METKLKHIKLFPIILKKEEKSLFKKINSILKIAKKKNSQKSRRNEIINIWEFRKWINKIDKNERWFLKNIKIYNFFD